MSTKDILKEINKLPVSEKLLLVEKTLRKIRSEAVYDQMIVAAEDMDSEYRSNKELTAFSNLDLDDFYEAR